MDLWYSILEMVLGWDAFGPEAELVSHLPAFCVIEYGLEECSFVGLSSMALTQNALGEHKDLSPGFL